MAGRRATAIMYYNVYDGKFSLFIIMGTKMMHSDCLGSCY